MMIKNRSTILIIDDSTLMREIASDMLKLLDLTVLTAVNGAEGLTVFQQNSIDLILLDVNMPIMNGAETYRALLDINPDIDVIICSTESQSKVQVRFDELPIPIYLHKPFDTGVLLDTVQDMLRKRPLLSH